MRFLIFGEQRSCTTLYVTFSLGAWVLSTWVRGCVLENLTGQQNISIINHLQNTAVQILVSAEET